MDDLDASILRELWRERVYIVGQLDPRLNPGAMARRVGVDPTTVRDRLRRWQRTGFLRGFAVLPSPALFGARVAGCGVRLDDVRSKAGVLEALALVPPVFMAVDHVGPWIGLGLVDEGRAATQRTLQLLGRIPGVAEVQPPFHPPAAVPTAALQALDWRIVAALRAQPAATLARVAASVGVSAATLTRRYARLVRGKALLVLPDLDFTRDPGRPIARLFVELAPRADAGKAARALEAAVQGTLLSTAVEVAPGVGIVEMIVHLPSAAGIEDAQVAALRVPGVAGVEPLLPRRLAVLPAWFDTQVERALATAGSQRVQAR